MKTARGSIVQVICFGIALGLLTNCAPIGQRNPRVSDQLQRSERESVSVPDGVTATIRQSDTMLHVDAKHVCEVHSKQVWVSTTVFENYNASPQTTWWAAALGVASAATGVGLIVDSQNMYDSDRNSRTYNEYDRSGQRGAGIGLSFLGGVLLTAAVVDIVRANGTTESTKEYTSKAVTDSPGQCSGIAQYANATVGVKLGNGVAVVGATNKRGVLDVDLDTALHPATVPDPKRAIAVLVNGTEVGKIDSRPLFKKREERAWRALDPATCLEPSTVHDCEPFEEFIVQFGNGAHATQAREVIERGNAVVQRIEREGAEEEAWARLDPELCSTGTVIQSESEAEAACRAVERHLARFPRGLHASEASEALTQGRARIAVLRARRQRPPPVVVPESGGI